MHLGTLTSVMVTRQDLNQIGAYEIEIDIPDIELPDHDRRGFLLTFIADCFRQASVDTGLPLNEKIWTLELDPTIAIIYSLHQRYRS